MIGNTRSTKMRTVSDAPSARRHDDQDDIAAARQELGQKLRRLIDESPYDGNITQLSDALAQGDPEGPDAEGWRSYLYQCIRGERTLGNKRAPAVAEALGIDPSELRLPPGSRRRPPAPNERQDEFERALQDLRDSRSRQDERTDRLEELLDQRTGDLRREIGELRGDLGGRLEQLLARLQEIAASQGRTSG